MRFREHRGSLADAMLTLVEIEPTLDALRKHLEGRPLIDAETIKASAYWGADERIGWAATFVIKDRHGVVGFTDEMPR